MAKNKGNNNQSDMKTMDATGAPEMTNMQQPNKAGNKKGSTNKQKGGAQNSK